jgi:hypothetical protein
MSMKSRPCQRCGKEIPSERIELVPDTRICVECSKAVGGEFDISTKPENLAKEGSLKKNYGSFEMKKTRRPIRRKDQQL